MKKPVITIPATLLPTSGLVVSGNSVYAGFTVDGRRRRKKLGPVTWSETLLAKARDSFYAGLIADGATVATRPKVTKATRKQRAATDPDKYLRHRQPWVVVIAGKIIAECGSKAEAKAARDLYLGL